MDKLNGFTELSIVEAQQVDGGAWYDTMMNVFAAIQMVFSAIPALIDFGTSLANSIKDLFKVA